MAANAYFGPGLFRFLKELKAHNQREWFRAHEQRYEEEVRQPFLRFIAAAAPQLKKINPDFVADPSPHGGSMMRIHRDIRFSKDKSPYKLFVAAHFQHVKEKGGTATSRWSRPPAGRAVAGRHSPATDARWRSGRLQVAAVGAGPAYYLRLEPGASMIGGGIWRPEARVLKQIRDRIVAQPDAWRKAKEERPGFGGTFAGEALKRAPAGYDANHPLIEDIKRKDFALGARLSDQEVIGGNFEDLACAKLLAVTPFVQFLAKAVGLPR